jgi:flagellar assembly factor FliW
MTRVLEDFSKDYCLSADIDTEMPQVQSKFFGTISFDEGDLFHFRNGIPGFEGEREYIGIEIPDQRPILYLQSTISEELCLITLPVRVFLNDYRFDVTPEERRLIELDATVALRIGSDVGCFAIVTVDESGEPAANLAAPIVMNLANRQCVQSFQADSDYSFRHPLSESPEPSPAC